MRLTAIALCSLAFCSCSLRLPVEPYPTDTTPVQAESGKTVEVWLHSDGYHTGMVFPYQWLLESGYIAPKGLGNPRAVVVSWGNVDAYSEEGIGSAHKWFQVIFTPTPSVMELIGINKPLPSVKPDQDLWKGSVPAYRGHHLAHFLNQCTQMDEDSKPVVVRPSSWGDGVQVEGRFDYFIPRVCNVWSAQAAETLGLEINPLKGTTSGGLTKQLEEQDFECIQKAD